MRDRCWANKINKMSIVIFKLLCEITIFITPVFKPREVKYHVTGLVVGPGLAGPVTFFIIS